ncbi:MAG: DNA topoisomerase IB [Acidimicrobiales bacterium]
MSNIASEDEFAVTVGLSKADPEEPGIVRQRCGRGFTFRWADGSVVRGEDRARCEALVLPPAWTDVWVCPDGDGHLQAIGIDDAGRRQYRYHDRWTEARAAANFDRLVGVGRRLADLRRAVTEDLESDDARVRALATMIGLLDRSLERVGNPDSVEEFGTRGISTLGPGNVDISRRSIQLQFRGKGGVDHDVTVDDDQLIGAVAELRTAADEWLFEVDESVLDAADANQYLDEHTAGHLDCKDLRTWGGSAAALTARVDGEAAEPQVADAAAEVLHNTRAVARSSYVHPAVFEATDEEVEMAWSSSRKSRWYGRGERALLNLLEDRPPLVEEHQVC